MAKITCKQLVEILVKFPGEAEIDIDADGYECDGVSMTVDGKVVLLHEFGLNELHFVE